MSQYDRWYFDTFSQNVMHLSQQKGSRLQGAVRNEMQKGEFAYYDTLAAVGSLATISVGDSTAYNTATQDRVRVGLVEKGFARLISDQEKLKTFYDPTSVYVEAAMWEFGRAKDDQIIDAAFGNMLTGRSGGTSTAFHANQTVDTTVGGAGTGLNIAKLEQAKYLLDANDVLDGQRYAVVGAKQVQDLLGTTEIRSSDYNTVKALAAGEVDSFMGFKFILSNRLPVASTVRDCLFFAEGGLLLATGVEPYVNVAPNPDKWDVPQITMKMQIGATRMETNKVLKVQCTET